MEKARSLEKAEFTNMCMIYDSNKVLIQYRKKSWKGIAFPGGHLEPMESIVDSVKREILEETGLTVNNLQICGVKQAFLMIDQDILFIFINQIVFQEI